MPVLVIYLLQVWALYALSLIADSGGPLFRNHAENTLKAVHYLINITSLQEVPLYRCLGKCLNSLLTTLGPELQLTSAGIVAARRMALSCAYILLDHFDPMVQSSGLCSLQQLQVYAPQHVQLGNTVKSVCASFESSSLILRRTVANCLRQFSQLQPAYVRQIASEKLGVNLELCILKSLNWEVNGRLCDDLKEVIFSLLSSLASQDPMHWLEFCNKILSAAASTSGNSHQVEGQGETEEEDQALHISKENEEEAGQSLSPKWQTRLFAMELVRKVYSACRSDPAHFDQTLALKKRQTTGGTYFSTICIHNCMK